MMLISAALAASSNNAKQRDAKTAARFCHPCWRRYNFEAASHNMKMVQG